VVGLLLDGDDEQRTVRSYDATKFHAVIFAAVPRLRNRRGRG
jgi:hypothetical protein